MTSSPAGRGSCRPRGRPRGAGGVGGRARVAGVVTLADLDDVAGRPARKALRAGAVPIRRSSGLDPGDRPEAGRRLNEAQRRIERAGRDTAPASSSVGRRAARLHADRLDLTEVVAPPAPGRLHLVQRTRDELEDVFVGHGLRRRRGARGRDRLVQLRSAAHAAGPPGPGDVGHALPRARGARDGACCAPTPRRCRSGSWRARAPPSTPSCPGKCYRRDTPDARHIPTFHQIEGLVVDHGISFADLAGTIETFTTAYFGPDIHARLRPSYFPFTEPSAEFEITCTICKGDGVPHVLADGVDRARRRAAWSTPPCSARSGSTPRSGRASPSASASTGAPRCATRSPTCASCFDNDVRVLRQI